MKNKFKIVAFLIIWSFFPGFVFAAEPVNPSGLPDVIVSQSIILGSNAVGTEITAPSGKKFYGGLGGSEAVLNYEPGYLHGFDQASFNPAITPNCVSLPQLPQCFILKFPSVQPTSVKLLTSRTYRSGIPQLEKAAILYPDNLITGDVYGFNNPNFDYSYFGKNLLLTPGSSGANAFWKLPSYNFNSKAQAYWSAFDRNRNQQASDAIAALKSKAAKLTSLPLPFFNGVCGPGYSASCPTTGPNPNQYPEGRVWVYTPPSGSDTVLAGSTLSYWNRGTIIITDGDLVIRSDINYSSGSTGSSLGFIVEKGNVRFESSNEKKITASFFVPNGNIEILKSNIQFVGSFVANDFLTAVGGVFNVSFIYDQRGEAVWPPGFRELQIPSLLAK